MGIMKMIRRRQLRGWDYKYTFIKAPKYIMFFTTIMSVFCWSYANRT